MSRWNSVRVTFLVAAYAIVVTAFVAAFDKSSVPFYVLGLIMPLASGLIVMALAVAWDYFYRQPLQPLGAFNVGVAGYLTLVLLSGACVNLARP
jgi:hypothetical protein